MTSAAFDDLGGRLPDRRGSDWVPPRPIPERAKAAAGPGLTGARAALAAGRSSIVQRVALAEWGCTCDPSLVEHVADGVMVVSRDHTLTCPAARKDRP